MFPPFASCLFSWHVGIDSKIEPLGRCELDAVDCNASEGLLCASKQHEMSSKCQQGESGGEERVSSPDFETHFLPRALRPSQQPKLHACRSQTCVHAELRYHNTSSHGQGGANTEAGGIGQPYTQFVRNSQRHRQRLPERMQRTSGRS